jgi:NAD(P)-dependent dehydrogenase (short-subunit alcohol dehydrogenase family)
MNSGSQFAQYPSLGGKVVLITGGASGIGASLVEHFVLQGAKVAFLDLDSRAAEALIAALSPRAKHVPAFLRCDITDITALRDSIRQFEESLGLVDVLINNAANDDRHAWQEVTPEYWDQRMAVNLRHHFFAIQSVAPKMIARGSGSIICMSSIAWIIPSTGLPAYVTAKAGIVGLTRTMAQELQGSPIRVNAILPGGILTERQRQLWWTPEYEKEILSNQCINRPILPEDVARLALFLGADDSSAITNQTFVVDGGWI